MRFAIVGLIAWMLAWPLAAQYERHGTWIAIIGTLVLCAGLILATR